LGTPDIQSGQEGLSKDRLLSLMNEYFGEVDILMANLDFKAGARVPRWVEEWKNSIIRAVSDVSENDLIDHDARESFLLEIKNICRSSSNSIKSARSYLVANKVNGFSRKLRDLLGSISISTDGDQDDEEVDDEDSHSEESEVENVSLIAALQLSSTAEVVSSVVRYFKNLLGFERAIPAFIFDENLFDFISKGQVDEIYEMICGFYEHMEKVVHNIFTRDPEIDLGRFLQSFSDECGKGFDFVPAILSTDVARKICEYMFREVRMSSALIDPSDCSVFLLRGIESGSSDVFRSEMKDRLSKLSKNGFHQREKDLIDCALVCDGCVNGTCNDIMTRINDTLYGGLPIRFVQQLRSFVLNMEPDDLLAMSNEPPLGGEDQFEMGYLIQSLTDVARTMGIINDIDLSIAISDGRLDDEIAGWVDFINGDTYQGQQVRHVSTLKPVLLKLVSRVEFKQEKQESDVAPVDVSNKAVLSEAVAARVNVALTRAMQLLAAAKTGPKRNPNITMIDALRRALSCGDSSLSQPQVLVLVEILEGVLDNSNVGGDGSLRSTLDSDKLLGVLLGSVEHLSPHTGHMSEFVADVVDREQSFEARIAELQVQITDMDVDALGQRKQLLVDAIAGFRQEILRLQGEIESQTEELRRLKRQLPNLVDGSKQMADLLKDMSGLNQSISEDRAKTDAFLSLISDKEAELQVLEVSLGQAGVLLSEHARLGTLADDFRLGLMELLEKCPVPSNDR